MPTIVKKAESVARQAAILNALREQDMTLKQLEAATGFTIPGMVLGGLARRGLVVGRNGTRRKGCDWERIYSIGNTLVLSDEVPLLCEVMGMAVPKMAYGTQHNLSDARHKRRRAKLCAWHWNSIEHGVIMADKPRYKEEFCNKCGKYRTGKFVPMHSTLTGKPNGKKCPVCQAKDANEQSRSG